jgi:GT2 family glycosyltransferase
VKISIVIPTIGNRSLEKTLNSIINSSIGVEEIILSLPPNSQFDISNLNNYSNLKLHISSLKGQVAQRIEGFKIAKNDLIVQLDDDIVLEKTCLELMFEFMIKNNNSCIAPHFYNIESNISIYVSLNQVKHKVFNQIKNGKNISIYGEITNSGFESYPVINQLETPFKTGWIPGGCVMHHRKNIVLENYFPFQGKAYSEDLFHSIELKNKNVELFYHPNAKAYLDVDNNKLSFKHLKKFILDDMRIRKKLVRDNNLNIFRMYTVYVIKFIKYLFS